MRANRLDSASGAFVGANGKKANYSLAMGYDNMNNITRKRQDVVQQSVKFDGILNAGYDLSYTYANNSQQIANIADASYRAERSSGMYATGSVASDSIDHKTHSYRYDANGNLLYVGTGKKINDSTLLESSTRRLLWDEDNRLMAISDNGYVSNYWYDASGERTVKQSGGSEGVFVNGVLSAARTQTSKFTAYVSPYLVVSNGGNYSKHIYVGSQRISSKLSNTSMFGGETPISEDPAMFNNFRPKYNEQTEAISARFDSLGVGFNGTLYLNETNTDAINSLDYAVTNMTPISYYYHPDHLGSSSLITDENGLMVQHIQYVPFGEVFVEERTTSWSTPYKFNAKELDPETGLYYYGARYYDPRTSVWLSVDPLAEKYPNVSSYVYCLNNPVQYVDPDGREVKAVFNRETKKLYILDLDHYKKDLPTVWVSANDYKLGGIRDKDGKLTHNQVLVVNNAFSGGQVENGIIVRDADNKRQKAIPKATYDIVDNNADTRHTGWFRLDRQDGSAYNDKDDVTNRDGYRLHLGGLSFGCVTIDCTQDDAVEIWNVVSSTLNTTSTTSVKENRGNQWLNPWSKLTKYGTMEVKGADKIPYRPKTTTE